MFSREFSKNVLPNTTKKPKLDNGFLPLTTTTSLQSSEMAVESGGAVSSASITIHENQTHTCATTTLIDHQEFEKITVTENNFSKYNGSIQEGAARNTNYY
ncbi:hypothetical protein OUZ56_012660 [Daphnia magna]|uniref:Uncharacterized protein n=1 Tax=Daphnia magna TaxID=35525 RepID=A0ABQ9Z3U8_9CRUS|nr:hypothetical protein OUZ56_012660 [Daphnia magna]